MFVTSTAATDPITGETIRLEDQESMVKAMAETNQQRQQQCKMAPFCQSPLVDGVGSLVGEDNVTAISDKTFVPTPGTPPGALKLLEVLKMPNFVKALGKI